MHITGSDAASDSGRPAGSIVLISQDLELGGAQRKIADLAAELAADPGTFAGTVYLLLGSGPPRDPAARSFFDVVAKSPVRILMRSSGSPVPFGLFCLWHVLLLRPTRVVAFLRGPGIVAVLLKRVLWWRQLEVGISDDSYASLALTEQVRNPVSLRVLSWIMGLCYRRADWIVAPSAAAGHDLARSFGVSSARIIVNRNWVQRRAPDPNAPDRFDLVFVGRLEPVKNLTLFVEVVRGVRELIPELRAVIVGEGSELDRLRDLRDGYGLRDALTFAGSRANVDDYLAASRIFCLTSHHEGLPLAALEAMAHGLPVICTPYAGADELVRDGVTGFLCRGTDDYVERVLQLLRNGDERVEMGRRARELVNDHHGPENRRRLVQLVVSGR